MQNTTIYMKKILLLLIICTQQLFAQENLLKELKNTHQFNQMDSLNEQIKTKAYSFYKAVYLNATNKPKASLKQLKNKNNDYLKDSYEYVKLLNDNAIKTFNYPLANETAKQLITTFKNEFNEAELNDEINNQRIWEILTTTPPQTISTFNTVEIKTQKDLAGLITVQVNNNGYSSDFVFDTGAGLNCITETQAKKLGINILPANQIEVESFTGQKSKVKIGVAKNILIGNIIINNAIFLVYPDEAFSFANGQYKINGIIGFPIIKELGTITIEEQQITAKKDKNSFQGRKNFFVEQLRPIVVIEFQGKKIPCNFDSGADSSLFTKSFYDIFQSYIDQNGIDEQMKSSSAGAEVIQKEVKVLENENLKIGNTTITLPEFIIDTSNYGVYGKVNYGNIGQDILSQFKKVTLSFDHNYIRLEN